MKRMKAFSWIFLLTISIFLLFPSFKVFASGKVYELTINKEIEMGLHQHLKRGFEEAKENNAQAIILKMHTPGGSVAAATEIGRLIDSSEIPVIVFIDSNAHSAGAYIALHADQIYMTPHATMGAAGVIDLSGNAAGEKAESAWFAQMTTAAENSGPNPNGRDPIYAQAMVDVNINMPEYNAPKGDFLTLTAKDAEKVGYSEGTVNSMEELLKTLKLEDAEVVSVDLTFTEKLARLITNPIIVPILLSVASIGLVVELYSPGFGVPGTMGLTALGMFFFGHLVAGFAGYETLIVFVIGLILVVAELFVPGGIIGIIGVEGSKNGFQIVGGEIGVGIEADHKFIVVVLLHDAVEECLAGVSYPPFLARPAQAGRTAVDDDQKKIRNLA